jgi:ATP-dependent Clp protease ATP-binding subunit ClpC
MITSDDDIVDAPTSESFPSENEDTNEGNESSFGGASNQKGNKKSKTPVLDNF